jgi:DNA-directed RNA polymerase subunit RPC12/RpoP
MAMVCPQCKETYEQRLQCPACNVRLLYKSGGAAAKGKKAEQSGKWMQSSPGRLLLGLLIAQGVYLGLRKLCTAGLLVIENPDIHGVWTMPFGVILAHTMQALGLLVGGTLAGAGYRRGTILGVIVGLASAAITLFFEPESGQEAATMALYLMQPVVGAIGGFLGCTIWKPVAASKNSKDGVLGDKKPPTSADPVYPAKFSGPISWIRVLAGAAVAVAGIYYAKNILTLIYQASDGKLAVENMEDAWQRILVLWGIKAFFLLLGSAVAGASTVNSLKQGLCVGLLVGVIQMGMFLGGGLGTLESSILVVVGGLVLGFVGGWFGGQLFPAYAGREATRFGPAAI